MKSIHILALCAFLALPVVFDSCTAAQQAQAKQAVSVAAPKAVGLAIATEVSGGNLAGIANPEAANAVQAIATVYGNNKTVVTLSAAALAALKDEADHQNTKQTISDALLAGINAFLNAPATPVPASVPPVTGTGAVPVVNVLP